MARKPVAPLPIITRELPRICPACGAYRPDRIDHFGIWTLRCTCGWSEKYIIKKEQP